MFVFIIYFVYIQGHWQLEAFDPEAVTNAYCYKLQRELLSLAPGVAKDGDIKVECLIDESERL
jgi:hypothetical protein